MVFAYSWKIVPSLLCKNKPITLVHFSLENSNVNSLSEIQKVMQQEQNEWERGKVGM